MMAFLNFVFNVVSAFVSSSYFSMFFLPLIAMLLIIISVRFFKYIFGGSLDV